MEYEQTQLRDTYSSPGWDAEVADGALKDDFLGATERCTAGFPLRAINRWMDSLEDGEYKRLEDLCT